MLTVAETRSLAERCVQIADEIADTDDFIAVRNLSERFDAELIIRPLLVEAMLASLEPGHLPENAPSRSRKWAIFLDSETYPELDESSIAGERLSYTLPPRLRNTVAHELVHSLAFRPKEFGVELTTKRKHRVSRREFIEAIERDTEKLSPLLLVPYRFLTEYLSSEKDNLSVHDLMAIQHQMGISRYVMVNRLRLLKLSDKRNILARPSLRNIAIGIGEWAGPNFARLKEWPLFLGFEKYIPEFLSDLSRGKLGTLSGVFDDPEFRLCGGELEQCQATVPGGTTKSRRLKMLDITCEVEPGSTSVGSEFLFIVKSTEAE